MEKQKYNVSFDLWDKVDDTIECARFLVEEEALAKQSLREPDIQMYQKVRRRCCGCGANGVPAPYAYRENAGALMYIIQDIKIGKISKEDYKSPSYIPFRN